MVTQRWRGGRATYRPAGEPIEASRYGVDVIPDDRTARAFVVQHHYSGSFPAARLRVGLYRARALVGVAVFSVPASSAVIPKWTALEPSAGVELGRFVLLDDVPANGETWFLARAFARLREELPAVRAVLSFSDPVARAAADGSAVMPGHVGTIYQAHNGRHVGRSNAATLYLDQRGRVVSHRALAKLRQDDRGAAYAYEQLRSAGAPTRRQGESGIEYVRRALREGPFRRFRHPGCLAYVWGLDRQTSRALLPALPYPKGDVRIAA